MPRTYAIVSPVRDEEEFIQFTIDSLVAQTILPAKWVIVDDGSSDSTGRIIDEAAAKHDWIEAVHLQNRGYRLPGAGVVTAFYEGMKHISVSDYGFIVKLDGDLSFDPEAFAQILEAFDADARLGISGGGIYHKSGETLTNEKVPEFHVRGACKVYRRTCWEAIQGLHVVAGWDTLDEVKANMLGWKTKNLKNVRLRHHRMTGTANGLLNGMVKNGRASFIAGYHPLYSFARGISYFVDRPYIIRGASYLFGFFSSYVMPINRIEDPQLISYMRKEQLKRLVLRSSIWR